MGVHGATEENAMTGRPIFDTSILQEPASMLPSRKALVHSQDTAVATALASMQHQHLSSVLVTATGREDSPVIGIFTERDVLHRVIDRCGDLALLPLNDVMTDDPVVGTQNSTLAWLLHQMSHNGMRHIPIVDEKRHPLCVISVRDIVTLLVESFPPDAIK
jgi:CBS domain-containing protein